MKNRRPQSADLVVLAALGELHTEFDHLLVYADFLMQLAARCRGVVPPGFSEPPGAAQKPPLSS